jgi:hypothetical protein
MGLVSQAGQLVTRRVLVADATPMIQRMNARLTFHITSDGHRDPLLCIGPRNLEKYRLNLHRFFKNTLNLGSPPLDS